MIEAMINKYTTVLRNSITDALRTSSHTGLVFGIKEKKLGCWLNILECDLIFFMF